MLGNLALVLSTDYAANGDRVAAALGAEDVTALVTTQEGAEEARRFLADDPRVRTVDVHEDLGGIATVAINGADSTVYGVFTARDDIPSIGRSRIVEEYATPVERPVWAPVTLQHNGYELGGPITMTLGGTEQTFHIQGWSETMFGSSTNMGQLTFLVPDTAGLTDQQGIVPLWTVRALTHDPAQAMAVTTDLSRHLADKAARLGVPSPLFYAMDMQTMQEVATLTSDMFAVIMVAFALVVVAIAVLVIRFAVRTAIAGDLRSLGSLMAAGYTSRQVIATYALPFLALAVAGGVLGIAASQLVLPSVADLLESQTGFTWRPGAPGAMALVTVGGLAVVIALSAVASARPVRTLPPVQALRGGEETHVFRRNRLPLETTRGPLALLVGLKQAAHQPAQAVTVFVTTAVVAWAATMSMAVYANVLSDTDRFIGVFMGELGDVEVGLARGSDGAAVLSRVQQHPGVERAIRVGMETATIGARDVYVWTTADFEQITNNQLYEGRMPRHDDEVAIGTGIVRSTGAGIGDEVEVTVGSRTASYLVTGLMQGGTRAGHFASMTDAGFTRLDPAYDLTMVRAYLAPGADRTAVIDDLTHELGADAALVRDQVEWASRRWARTCR